MPRDDVFPSNVKMLMIPPVNPDDAASILRAAAAVLQRDGHLHGDYGSIDGPKCMMGALQYVRYGIVMPRPQLWDITFISALNKLAITVDYHKLYSYSPSDAHAAICEFNNRNRSDTCVDKLREAANAAG